MRLNFHCRPKKAGVRFFLFNNQLPMSNSADNGSELVRKSSLYREFQAEREEILKHKWIESEKAGYDIGFERALTDWIVKHRANWRKARQQTERHQVN